MIIVLQLAIILDLGEIDEISWILKMAVPGLVP